MIIRTRPNAERVVVIGANSPTGRRLLPMLRSISAHTTALVRHPAALPADEIIADWTRNPQAFEAIANADAIILLTGIFAAADWAAYEAATVKPAQLVAEFVDRKPVRVVYFSFVGADAEDSNWYLKSKGLAERALDALPEAVIFRIGPIVTGGAEPSAFEQMLLQHTPGAPVPVFGDGAQRCRPIHIDDVAEIALAASQGAGSVGTFDFGGPDEYSLIELVQRVNGFDVPVQTVSVERAAQMPGVPITAVDVIARIKPARGIEHTAALFGVDLTPLSAIWPLVTDDV